MKGRLNSRPAGASFWLELRRKMYLWEKRPVLVFLFMEKGEKEKATKLFYEIRSSENSYLSINYKVKNIGFYYHSGKAIAVPALAPARIVSREKKEEKLLDYVIVII